MPQQGSIANGVDRTPIAENNHYAMWLVPVLVWMFGATAFFRQQIISDFDLVSGSIGDARLIIFINENWFKAFTGQADFLSPTLFYPLQGTLGYSDAFVLYQIFYTPFRFLGADEFMAFQLTLVGLTAIGFASFFALLRRAFDLPVLLASAGALIFAFSNMIFIVVDHAQHLTVEFVPLLILLGFEAVKSIPDAPRRACIYSGSMGACLALVFFTSYYIGWFFVLGSLIFVPVLLVMRRNDALFTIAAYRTRIALCLLVFIACFLVFLTPFVITYLPVLLEGRQRSYEENMGYAGVITDLVNVGDGNLLWGKILENLPGYPDQRLLNAEARLSTTPLLMITMIVGAFLVVRHDKSHLIVPRFRIDLILALTITALVLQAISIRFGHFSLWWLVWKFVPGGSAIRVPFRLQFMTGVTVTLAVLLILDYWYRAERLKGSVARPAALIALVAFLVIEQVNLTPTALIDRSQELVRLDEVPPVPERCRTFYIADSNPAGRPPFAYQIDAMLISQRAGIPTVNGYSGWGPKDWALEDPTVATYTKSADRWLRNNGLVDQACVLDQATRTWTPHRTPEPKLLPVGQPADFTAGGNSDSFIVPGGWSGPEPSGRWTDGSPAALEMKIELPIDGAIELVAEAAAYISERHPEQEVEVLVNNRKVGVWNFKADSAAFAERRLYIPPELVRSIPVTTISFNLLNPASPQALGYSTDNRTLGIQIRKLRLVGVPVAVVSQRP